MEKLGIEDALQVLEKSMTPGIQYLSEGYLGYAEEVICERALPNICDGLKPSQRRGLYTAKSKHTPKDKNAKRKLIKSERLAADTMALHPHGSGSIYLTVATMTDNAKAIQIPWFDGQGNFGSLESPRPASPRYTELRLHKNADELFGEMNGIKMLSNYDDSEKEPELLPVSFPAVLVNPSSGLAVAFRSNIPAFNFVDVCNLVKEYILEEKCTTVLEPDFMSRGYYVRDQKELLKIMHTGKGKLKLRARYYIDGAKIHFVELPYGKTMDSLINRIVELNLPEIASVMNGTDDTVGTDLIVICKNKKCTESVAYKLIKETDLQYNYSVDITVVDRGAPRTLGVYDVIARWVEWRKEVLEKDFKVRLQDELDRSEFDRAFVELIDNEELKWDVINTIVNEGKKAGAELLVSKGVKPEIAKWLSTRSLDSYHNDGSARSKIESTMNNISSIEASINDLGSCIIRDMNRLITTYGGSTPRMTEVTDVDYIFSEDEEAGVIVDDSPCVFSYKNGFIRKLRYESGSEGYNEFAGYCNDILIAFDNRGRIIRIYADDIPVTTHSDLGVYIARYAGIDEKDDYEVKWVGRLDGSTLTLLYKDGNIGFVDTSEWLYNNRRVKVLESGIACSSAPYLGAVLREVPEIIYVSDESGNLAWRHTATIKQKHRTAKTRAFTLKDDALLDSYWGTKYLDGVLLLEDINKYSSKLSRFSMNDVRDPDRLEEFISM